jgi:SNF2 family DNA or RNA helicase
MLKFDTRNYDDKTREALAWKVRGWEDYDLPRLTYWDYDLCRTHKHGWVEDYFDAETQQDKQRTIYDRPKPGCRKCGIHFRQHQRVSIMWLYLKKRALLADTMGSGKTTSAGGLIAMLKETGELSQFKRAGGKEGVGRVVITPRAPALHQWHDELKRMIPSLRIIVAEGPQAKRRAMYSGQPWDVLLIGPEMLRNDFDTISRFDLSLVVTDDIDQLRNPLTEASYFLDRLGGQADRYVIMTGTPLQKKLPEIHSILDGIGGLEAFGSLEYFTKRHVRTSSVMEYDSRTGLPTTKLQVTGYQNLGEVKAKMAPMVMRRTAADLKDVTLPTIVPDDVFLDLYPAQRAKYNELKKGVIRILREEGELVKHMTALSKLHYGSAICGGLASLGEPDGPRTSMKMDWILNKVSEGGDLGDEKVVVFANLKNSIRSLQYRLRDAGIGFTTVWGEEPDKTERRRRQERFWEDPNCRILLGTKSIEQSLNLQVSRHLINMDMILNPARMEQLAGRIRRDGSAFQHVFVHNLLTIDTQEARYLGLLEREAALAAHIWDENSELFNQLSPMALLQLISG